jgi:hypothetical protein
VLGEIPDSIPTTIVIDYHDGEHDDPPGASPIEVVDSLYAPVVENAVVFFVGYRVSVRMRE